MNWQEILQNSGIRIVLPITIIIGILKWLISKIGFYNWRPKERLTNNATKNINSYPKSLKLKNGDLCIENGNIALTSNEDAFSQNLQSFMYVSIGEIHDNPEYGCEFVDSIFKANKKEFERQCHYLAKAIIEHKTFKDYIEEIYGIHRRKEKYIWGKNVLIIELKMKGRPDTLIIQLSSINDLIKQVPS